MKIVRIEADLTEAEAWEYAQFLKRVWRRDYLPFTTGAPTGPTESEAYLMASAGEKIRDGLARAGYAPR